MPEHSVLSIDETDKLRATLGLPPLNSTTNNEGQFEKPPPATEKKPTATRRPRAPVVQTHSDDDDEIGSLDARKWVERLKQQKKTPATQKPQGPIRKEYSAAELAGLRVSHDVSDLGGGEHVLTLQDKSIDELDTDDGAVELHSVALAETKRAQKNAEDTRKRMRPLGGGANEAEEEPKADLFFTIKDGGIIDSETAEEQHQRELHQRRGQTAISLDGEAPSRVVSDFYTEEEAAALFRKPKKPKVSDSTKDKKGKRRQRQGKTSTTNDFVEAADLMDVDAGNAIFSRRSRIDDSSLADDDEDLQRAIAAVRRTANKSALLTAEDIAQQVHDDALTRMDATDTPTANNPELALSSTIEFVQSLKAAAAAAAAAPTTAPATTKKPEVVDPAEEEKAVPMEKESPVEKEDPEVESETVIVKRSVVPRPTDTPVEQPDPEAEEVTTKEPSVGSGLFATLSLLRQRNMLDKLTDDQRQRELQQRSRDTLLAEQRRQDAALTLERQRIKLLGARNQKQAPAPDKKQRRGKADELTPQELDEIKAREQEALDRKWAREYEERMRDYKPQVNLEYVDETGRKLTTKEAYKQLSHAFHGHYSGKNKIDKVMAKRERERKQLELTSGASTHQYGAVLENAHKKLGSAGIVLASGNKPGLGPSSSSSSSKDRRPPPA
ncbi:hypothetical protein GGH94_004242 [Coemansia aciculifera]|uniref:SART-1 protein n=1 Tax=Coemansia aciculifera TaxID=417176 RepID=A0A9W8M504_9FUNG|nr:hypothetical protein GGH94_004242 [Coemansia aciculifera]